MPRRAAAAVLVLALGLLAVTAGRAQAGVSVLAAFDPNTSGSGPSSSVIFDGLGNIYGTTTSGGLGGSGFGTVYKYDGASLTPIVSFDESNGSGPFAGVILANGYLYGTTNTQTTNDAGLIYRVATDGTNFSVVAAFTGPNGAFAQGTLVSNGAGTLYGTTYAGGAAFSVSPSNPGYGTVFSLDVTTPVPTLTTQLSFDGTAGVNPGGGVVVAGGTLFGTTLNGGANNSGTLYRADQAAPLYEFDSATTGAQPEGSMVLRNNILYGTTSNGGPNSYGTIFSYDLTSNTFSTLYAFNYGASPSDGAFPFGTLTVDASGRLFGTTTAGGDSNNGTVFEFDLNSMLYTTLYSFTGGADGASPVGGVIIGPDGSLYGTTQLGGANGSGTLYSLSLAAVPEPSSLLLSAGLLVAAGSMSVWRRRGVRVR